jgi:hypothetical protein
MFIDLPVTFYSDRAERDLPVPKIVKRKGRTLKVAANDPALTDMLSDAEYYSDIVRNSGDTAYLGLQSSARATVKAIKQSWNL